MDRITLLDGRSFRVELNWNAIVAFLEESGRDDVREIANFGTLKPSDLAGLLAAGINEGARLDGESITISPKEVGSLSDMTVMAQFIGIFSKQMHPKGLDAKKK